MGNRSRKELVAQRAERQWGRVTWEQLRELGVPKRTISLWCEQGYLHRRIPRVYAVGHPGSSPEASLAEALLYAGPGAMLSHVTAAWWLGLHPDQPTRIHVSTPRQCKCQPGIMVHQRRRLPRQWHKRMPITSVPQLLLDLAASEPLRVVRLALARADYRGRLDVSAVNEILGAGRPGSAALRGALQEHQPKLARTKSDLEIMFMEICERAGLVLPEINVQIAGWEVDAFFRDQRIAVELDGYGNHRSPAQIRRDRRKDMALRRARCLPVRYSDDQLENHAGEIIADLHRLGAGTGKASYRNAIPSPR